MKMRFFLVVLLAFVAGGSAMYFWKRSQPKARVELSALKEQLAQAAERNLPMPSLAIKQVEVTVDAEKQDAFIAETLVLAKNFGGTALLALDRADTRVILVTLPQRWLESFITAVQKYPPEQITPKQMENGEAMTDCEVLIRAPAAR